MINIIIGEINRIRNTRSPTPNSASPAKAFAQQLRVPVRLHVQHPHRMMSLDYLKAFTRLPMQTFQKRIAGVTLPTCAAWPARTLGQADHPGGISTSSTKRASQSGRCRNWTSPSRHRRRDEAPAATPPLPGQGRGAAEPSDRRRRPATSWTRSASILRQKSTLQLAPQMSFTFDVDSYTFLPDQLAVKMASPVRAATIVRAFDGKASADAPRGSRTCRPPISRRSWNPSRSRWSSWKRSRVEGARGRLRGRADVMGRVRIRSTSPSARKASACMPIGHGHARRAGLRRQLQQQAGQFIQLFSNPAGWMACPIPSETYFNGLKSASGSIQTWN